MCMSYLSAGLNHIHAAPKKTREVTGSPEAGISEAISPDPFFNNTFFLLGLKAEGQLLFSY